MTQKCHTTITKGYIQKTTKHSQHNAKQTHKTNQTQDWSRHKKQHWRQKTKHNNQDTTHNTHTMWCNSQMITLTYWIEQTLVVSFSWFSHQFWLPPNGSQTSYLTPHRAWVLRSFSINNQMKRTAVQFPFFPSKADNTHSTLEPKYSNCCF